MDRPESESTPPESEVPSTKPVEFISYGEWNNIYRAIIEQQVPPGTQFFQYKNRIVPLGWEPRPLVSITLPFSTVGEAMAYIGKTPEETLSGVGTTTQSNEPSSNADNHSPEDTLSRVGSAVSNLHIDGPQMSAVGETVSEVGTAPQSNVSTGSAGNHSPEDTSASVEEKTSPSGESASSNLHISDQLGWCDYVLDELHELSLQKRAGDDDVPKDSAGHQVTISESLTQDAEPNASSCFKASTIWLEELLKEEPIQLDAEYKKRMQNLLSTMKELEIAEKNAEEQSRILQSAIDTASVSTEGRDEEITGSTNARSPIKLGTSKIAEAAKSRKEEKERFAARKHARKLKRIVRGSGPIFVKAFPKDAADIKDWNDILEALKRENVPKFTESFTFRGRKVLLDWRIASGDDLRRELNRQVALVNRRLNDRTGGDPLTTGASTSSTSTLDVVEEQTPDDGNCAASGESNSPKKRIRSRRKK